jgi:hypothetical protein
MNAPNQAQVEAVAAIVNALLPLGISAAQALVSAIKAVHGDDLTPAEMMAMINWLEEDSLIRAALAKADAGKDDGA